MSRLAVRGFLGTSFLLLALATSAAQATPGDDFTATITPTAVQPLSSHAYTVQLANLGSSGESADNAHVAVPSGFAVDEATLSASTSAAGSCSAAAWAVTLNSGTSTIDASAADATGDLCPGATLTLVFNATAPSAEADYEWTATLLGGASPFALQGSQPVVTVDGTPPPPPNLTETPPNPSDSSTATFGFSDSEQAATFSCQLDGGAFAPCPSQTTFTGLAEGAHTFAVEAVDAVGNASPPTSYGWTIDLTPPPPPTLTPGPPSVTASTSATFAFADGDSTATFACQIDGGAFAPCPSPITYGALAEGAHTFAVKAVDPAGNKSPPTSYTWTIDLTNPVVAIDPASKPPDPTNQTGVSFVFTSNKAGSTFECRLDTLVFTSCTSPKAYSVLADGRHTFGVRATDPAGNVGLAAEYAWTVDTPPGTVKGLKRRVAYRLLRLTWSLPANPDLDHVVVMRSRSARGGARSVVYKGRGTGYTDKRFQNGAYYRYVVVTYDQAGKSSPGVRVVVPPSVLLRSPRNGGVVTGPPLLLWSGVPRASYYNVQVYRGSQKLLSAWPAKARLGLRSKWVYQGHTFRLQKGAYRWWVWPAFGPRSKAAYGQLLGTGTFVVR